MRIRLRGWANEIGSAVGLCGHGIADDLANESGLPLHAAGRYHQQEQLPRHQRQGAPPLTVVLPPMTLSNASCTTLSERASRADVASSRRRMRGAFTMARAIAMRCFCGIQKERVGGGDSGADRVRKQQVVENNATRPGRGRVHSPALRTFAGLFLPPMCALTCPPDMCRPFSPTRVCTPSGSFLMNFHAFAALRAVICRATHSQQVIRRRGREKPMMPMTADSFVPHPASSPTSDRSHGCPPLLIPTRLTTSSSEAPGLP